MKKFISMLSLAAIVASALFVSCAQPKTPDVIPAFPTTKTATYAPNAKGVYEWTFASDYKYTNAKGGGFLVNTFDKSVLDYTITPNFEWSIEIVGEGKEYVQVRSGYGFDNDDPTFVIGDTANGPRGKNVLGFFVIKTPEVGEEAVECVVNMTMAGETMPIAIFVIEPSEE